MLLSVVVLIGIILLFVIMIAGGIYFLIKYKQTKQKKFLIIGLILTFIVIGIIAYILISIPSTMVTYAPPEMM